MNKVVLIGCGNVGMSYAYALLNQRTLVNELVIIDKNNLKAIGEVMDLNHCLPYAPSKIKIKAGDYSECSDATIIVISAGASTKGNMSRMDLIYRNSAIFKSIISKVVSSGFKGIFLVATNPLDVMTFLTYKYSGFSSNKVIGSGTSLDTSRLRYNLSSKLHVSPSNIHGYVIGEHGDSEFIAWSNVMVGSSKLNLNDEQKSLVLDEVRNSAYEIIEKKGNTCYGIGMCLLRITNAILEDENAIITVSAYNKDKNCFIGYPAVINKFGVKSLLKLNLTLEEEEMFDNSASIIKEAIKKVL